jgi:hypothetical protein
VGKSSADSEADACEHRVEKFIVWEDLTVLSGQKADVEIFTAIFLIKHQTRRQGAGDRIKFLMRFSLWCCVCATIGLSKYLGLLLGSHLSRRLQCLANEWIFGLFREREQPVAVLAIDLKAVTNSLRLLAKHARAAWAPDFDLIVH